MMRASGRISRISPAERKFDGILSTTCRRPAASGATVSEIGLAQRLELARRQIADARRGSPELVDERLQPLELARAMDHRMRREDLLDERRARARHADHEDRQVGTRALARFRRQQRGREDLGDARHPASFASAS